MDRMRIVGFFLVSVIAAFLAGLLFQNPLQVSRAAAPNAMKTPTISKKVNARFLENRRANAFMPTTQANQFLAASSAGQFLPTTSAAAFMPTSIAAQFVASSNQAGIARAGALVYCRYPEYQVLRSFNLENGSVPVITHEENPDDAELNPRQCFVDFGFDLTNAIVGLDVSRSENLSFGVDGTVLYINMQDSVYNMDSTYNIILH